VATPHGLFVTGTDTGVGKTLVACALLHALAASGRRVAGMKPVAAGAHAAEHGLINDDVEQLIAASNVSASRALINPYSFAPAVAPHIAARAAGVTIELASVIGAARQLAERADFIVVEGVGGFCVPLNAAEDTADLARGLGLPVLLVVGMRLGCLNHALLTAQAIRAQGLTLAAWCANQIDGSMACVDENIAALAARLHAPPLGRIPFSPAPDARAIAADLNVTALSFASRERFPGSVAGAETG
jgi:dethiobiotin synthetase